MSDNQARRGGVAYGDLDSVTTVLKSNLTANTAHVGGGAIYLGATASVYITSSIASENSGPNGGIQEPVPPTHPPTTTSSHAPCSTFALLPPGVLQLAVSSEGFVTESHIHNNIAGNLGGAFHLQGSNVTLRVKSAIIEAYVHAAIAWVSPRPIHC